MALDTGRGAINRSDKKNLDACLYWMNATVPRVAVEKLEDRDAEVRDKLLSSTEESLIMVNYIGIVWSKKRSVATRIHEHQVRQEIPFERILALTGTDIQIQYAVIAHGFSKQIIAIEDLLYPLLVKASSFANVGDNMFAIHHSIMSSKDSSMLLKAAKVYLDHNCLTIQGYQARVKRSLLLGQSYRQLLKFSKEEGAPAGRVGNMYKISVVGLMIRLTVVPDLQSERFDLC
jgi:hypothetical protein